MVSVSINEVMKIGCEGMSVSQKSAERERRIKVCERINQIGEKLSVVQIAYQKVQNQKGSEALRKAKAQKRHLVKVFDQIKAEESEWLKEAAWFLY